LEIFIISAKNWLEAKTYNVIFYTSLSLPHTPVKHFKALSLTSGQIARASSTTVWAASMISIIIKHMFCTTMIFKYIINQCAY
jgi:hypothetical protein